MEVKSGDRLKQYQKTQNPGVGSLDIPDIVGSAQLSTILGTAHVLRNMLCL